MTCSYNKSCVRVFHSPIKLQPECVLGVTNMVPQALCKHGLRAQALCGSSMVMTRRQSKTQPARPDSYGSPCHMTECLTAIATVSCLIACCILVSLERQVMNISRVPACEGKDKFQLKEKSLCILKS